MRLIIFEDNSGEEFEIYVTQEQFEILVNSDNWRKEIWNLFTNTDWYTDWYLGYKDWDFNDIIDWWEWEE